METVKTYHKVDASNEKASFAISRMQDVYEKRKGKKDEAHRHEFFTILLIEDASGIHKIDFNTYPLGTHQVFFVSPGQVHQLIEEKASIGFSMTFSIQFLIENAIHLSFIESLNLFKNYGQNPPLEPDDKQFEKLSQYSTEMYSLFKEKSKLKELSIGAYLKLLLIECNTICSVHPIESYVNTSENRIIREFKQLVDSYYKKEHSTSFYAEQLHISADHLNRIIKGKIGKTSKEYIQSRITTEAKRLLYFSKLSNKEIGYQLGFNEPANFSAFFKKCTGFSPSKFLQEELQQ